MENLDSLANEELEQGRAENVGNAFVVQNSLSGNVINDDAVSADIVNDNAVRVNAINDGEKDNFVSETAPAEDNGEVSSLLRVDGNGFDGEAFGKIKYLTNERNLNLPVFRGETVDADAPFSSFTMAGKWLREAADLSNYWQGIQRLGEEVAAYKWAYNEGELGEFDGQKFAAETLRAGVRSLGQDTLRTTGNLLTMFGANLENGAAAPMIMTSGAGAILPQTGELFKKLGNAFRSYADNIENISFLATPKEAFEDEPSWTKLANTLGAGSSQVLAMAGMSRFIGAGATYGFFAGGGAGEIFNETLEKGGDVEQANTLAAANAGVTFAIDKLFDPLPETIAKNAKLTSQKIGKEILGAPLREAGSEVLQQMLAENLVRKVGLDDTQDLFEGLLESALGAFAGSAVVSVPSGGSMYLAQRNLNNARQKILDKGVTSEELGLYEKNMMAMIEQKPEAFEKILGANLEENLRQMDKAARKLKNREEREEKRNDVQAFQDVYDEVYERILPVLGEEQKARAAARLFEAQAISLYRYNSNLTPRKLLENWLPEFKKTDAASFLAKKLSDQSVSFSLIGINAKNANTTKLTQAMAMTENGADPVTVWQYTGWHLGGDGKWRMEISDRNATLKNIDRFDLGEGIVDMLHDHKLEMERIKAYLAAALRNSAMNGYGHFYKEFYDYLKKEAEEVPVVETPEEQIRKLKDGADMVYAENGELPLKMPEEPRRKLGMFEVIEEADRQKREIEDLLLADLMDRYRQMHPEHKKDVPFDEVIRDLEAKGTKTYDFTQEQYDYIMWVFEKRRRKAFFDEYWDPRFGVEKSDKFRVLAEFKNFTYNDNPQYIESLATVYDNARRKRQGRTAELERLGLEKYAYFFEDIDKDEAYGKYRAYQGDFSPDMSHKNFYPTSYRLAYMPKTASERYLAQKKFSYMSDAKKRVLAGYLDIEEKIFHADRYLNGVKSVDEMQQVSLNQPDSLAKLRLPDGRINWEYVQQKKEQQAKMTGRLGDILEHPQLFENYPDLADMTVKFTFLGKTPYHAYYDADKGYVLEVNVARVGKSNLKEVLLKGAAFAVQDMEGFDYSLTEEQRRNFMDRQIFMASREIEPIVLKNMQEYVDHYLPGVNPDKFVVSNFYPLPLAGLTRSYHDNVPAKRLSFYTVDYDKLSRYVRQKYGKGMQKDGIRIRHLAYMDLQQIQRQNDSMLMAEARATGGYSAGLMPWTGVTSQGAMDDRALSRRMEYSDKKLAESPFFDVNDDLRAIRENVRKGVTSEINYIPDVMDPYTEFAENIKQDKKLLQRKLYTLAKGAYDSAERTINLFETADTDTIVHETFHYFWDLMEKNDNRTESHGATFHEVMGELREELVRDYVFKEFDGKWFVLHKENDDIMEELPRGFASKGEAIDAGVRELFVKQFLQILNPKALYHTAGKIADAANFYRQWLLVLTDKLDIRAKKASAGGKALLRILKNKIK